MILTLCCEILIIEDSSTLCVLHRPRYPGPHITCCILRCLTGVLGDKVRMYEEIMTNDDNLESSRPTFSLLKCVLWYKLNCVCVYCPVAGDELTLSVLHDLTLQVNLFSGNVIYWLPQFTWKYNGMLINGHKSRCGRSGV